MSEVKPFKIEFQPSGEVRKCVYFEDFDAQRLRADTAEAERDALREAYKKYSSKLVVDALNADLAAAEQRIAELKGVLKYLLEAYSKPNDRICCNGDGCGCMGTTIQQQAEYYAKEALNPNPEAESHA